ncbi:MAG: histidine--tRNA ligase [Verrucomicrobiales bacterium]
MRQANQSLPGFRDLYPRDCAIRNYLFDAWRRVSSRYGFIEWDGPTLEATDLYRRKSGDEITRQLFSFEDKGGREVALRPELTPTIARMVAEKHRDFRKPMKWFQIGACFRYETPQKGRLREFCQWNADVLGEPSIEADAELIALGIDLLRELGFASPDFAVRVSNRDLWNQFVLEEKIDAGRTTEFLQVIDKWDREKAKNLEESLVGLGTSPSAVAAFIERMRSERTPFMPLVNALAARGLDQFVRVEPGIVRGLAYYTGTVFEFFALRGGRAIAGGGRYDGLCALISDGAAKLPAAGFAMGDVVLADLIASTPRANTGLQQFLGRAGALDAYVIVADEAHRAQAVAILQKLRDAGLRCDYAMAPAKVSKQFQTAEALHARTAIIIGSEFPVIKIKDLASRQETAGDLSALVDLVAAVLAQEPQGPMLAEES